MWCSLNIPAISFSLCILFLMIPWIDGINRKREEKSKHPVFGEFVSIKSLHGPLYYKLISIHVIKVCIVFVLRKMLIRLIEKLMFQVKVYHGIMFFHSLLWQWWWIRICKWLVPTTNVSKICGISLPSPIGFNRTIATREIVFCSTNIEFIWP